MSAVFDRFMCANNIGTNRKLRRLPVAQRWTYVAGVLALASQSPIRGALLITDGEPVTAEDVAEEATVSLSVATAALDSFRKLGMLDRDEHGIEWVHDWDKLNPSPKPSDSPDATRARKRDQRARDKAARGGVTSRPRHAMSRREVEVEGKTNTPPAPQGGSSSVAPMKPEGNRKADLGKYDTAMAEWCSHHFPGADPRAVRSVIVWARLPEPVSADDLRTAATKDPMWAAQLGQEAAA